MRILFICTGNTCRSPMAALLAKQKSALRNLNVQIDSAGLYAMSGAPMSPYAARAMEQRDLDAQSHTAKTVTAELLASADLVLSMTASHASNLRGRYPEHARKIHQLGAFAAGLVDELNARYDIVDPYGGTPGEYQSCAGELDRVLDQLFDRLEPGLKHTHDTDPSDEPGSAD